MTEVMERILKYKENNPTASLRSIGEAVQTSHEYVRLVLKTNNISTKRMRRQSSYCRTNTCSNILSTYQKKHTKICTSCRKLKMSKE